MHSKKQWNGQKKIWEQNEETTKRLKEFGRWNEKPEGLCSRVTVNEDKNSLTAGWDRLSDIWSVFLWLRSTKYRAGQEHLLKVVILEKLVGKKKKQKNFRPLSNAMHIGQIKMD